MSEHNCADCAFRAKYDQKPTSILGRLWRWHANWCPGWNAYMNALPENEKHSIAERYNMKKFLIQH